MNRLVTGLHHITALSSNAQENLNFYSGILGLRMVKKTINFDAPEVYHLYYGNEEGSPGTIITFFPYPNIQKGRRGKGQLTVTSFSIPIHAVAYWIKRLDKFRVMRSEPQERFNDEVYIYLEDNDGLGLELVANIQDDKPGFTYGNIPPEFAIRGFYGVTLCEEGYEKTRDLLVLKMNHKAIAEQGNRFRYSVSGNPGDFIDVLCSPDAIQSTGGAGTVHHVAFATADTGTQRTMRESLVQSGFNVSPVLNREYFHSIYFREPGGILFEIATASPGFAVDEPLGHLGETLKLPSWQEQNRKSIEQLLPSINLDLKRFTD